MAPTIEESNPQLNSITFVELLDQIRLAFSRPDNRVDVDDLWRILESYKSDPNDWNKYAFYDYHRYKRNLVDGQDNYNVMVLCWPANTRSCIHDHSGSHCFMKVSFQSNHSTWSLLKVLTNFYSLDPRRRVDRETFCLAGSNQRTRRDDRKHRLRRGDETNHRG